MIAVRYDPAPAPTLEGAIVDLVLHDDEESSAVVVFPGILVEFTRAAAGETWQGGGCTTRCANTMIDEGYITAARDLAVEALHRELAARGSPVEAHAETVRCSECQRVIASPELGRSEGGRITGIDCGPDHVVRFSNRRALVVTAAGAATWSRS